MKICQKNFFLEVWHVQGHFSTRIPMKFELFIFSIDKFSIWNKFKKKKNLVVFSFIKIF